MSDSTASATATRPDPLLRAEGITAGYGGVPVIQDVSLSVGERRMTLSLWSAVPLKCCELPVETYRLPALSIEAPPVAQIDAPVAAAGTS